MTSEPLRLSCTLIARIAALATCWAFVGSACAEVSALSLGKATDAKSRAEPAELSYLNDAASGSSYGLQAALIWAPQAAFTTDSAATYQWDLALGINKNTISGDKRTDKFTGALGGRAVLDLNPEAKLLMRAALERRQNRITDGRESALSMTGMFDLNSLEANGRINPQYGYDFKPLPYIGLYHTSTSGNTVATARNGHFGAPFIGLDLTLGLFKENIKGRWIALDITVRRQFEQWTSGDFNKENYDFGSIALRIPFETGGDGAGSISLAHTRGTDRLTGEPWKRRTLLTLTLKFGSS